MSRLIEALQQNVWSSVRMHESASTAAPAAAAQEQAADSAAEGGAAEHDASGGGGPPAGADGGPDLDAMFREVSRFKASAGSMSREERHRAAESIAMSWGLGDVDGDSDDDE